MGSTPLRFTVQGRPHRVGLVHQPGFTTGLLLFGTTGGCVCFGISNISARVGQKHVTRGGFVFSGAALKPGKTRKATFGVVSLKLLPLHGTVIQMCEIHSVYCGSPRLLLAAAG